MSQAREPRGVQFNVVHLSDLHFGMNGLDWMWPTFKTHFYNDLRQQYARTGPWDLVIFSGDLTQRGSAEEYAALTDALVELWDVFSSLGCSPKLFVVPGNHDLQRPSKIDAHALALASWWQTEEIHQDFWVNNSSPYRKKVSDAFAEFVAWTNSLASTSISLITECHGILPGDASARIQKDGVSLGLIGLNSAWLQLTDKDVFGKLNVHVHQLLSVTDKNPDAWVASNSFNLLVTHHPTAWLHKDALAHWNSEIHTNARFTAHLFGHMHEGVALQSGVNGSAKKIAIQSPSIFGLETLSNGTHRCHGYSLLCLADIANERKIRIWPRLAYERPDGSRKLIANPNWDLEDDACEFHVEAHTPGRVSPRQDFAADASDKPRETLLSDDLEASRILKSLRRSNAHSLAAASVRKEEQQFLMAALTSSRQGWLVDTWGTGGDAFINVVCTRLLGAEAEVYYLPVGSFDGQEQFLSNVRPRLGCSLEELCRALDQRRCVLVLDDVTIEGSNRTQLEQELLFIVETLLEFSEQLHVIIRSRSKPADLGRFTELRPLDEADVTAYVNSQGQTSILTQDVIERIFLHSGGLPARIDAILRGIEVVGTQALYDLDADIVGKAASQPDDIPQALVVAIQELIDSDDEHSCRAGMLLKVLSLFPQGEPFLRIRRFFGAKAFYPSHATLLLERGLIESNPITSLEGAALSQERGNALTVRRPAREYLVQNLSATERKDLNSKALKLYFGENWALRGIQSPTDLKFDSAHRSALEIANASTLILREARASTDSQSHSRVKSALALSESFVSQLTTGDHFRGVAQFLEGAIQIFEDYLSTPATKLAKMPPFSLTSLLYAQARALRMLGEHERALQITSKINLEGQSNSLKESTLLTIALCKESLGAPPAEVIAAAEASRKINPKSASALNARYLIVRCEQAPNQQTLLRELYAEARKKGYTTVANNIALTLSDLTNDTQQKKTLLNEALTSGRTQKDHYNFVRALLRISRLDMKESGRLSPQHFDDCIRAYSYIYNQRIDSLFESCHQILWEAFESKGDERNLLTLYRYSSLVWRLRKKTKTEQKYRDALTTILGSRLSKSILAADRELRYFISRGTPPAVELPQPQH